MIFKVITVISLLKICKADSSTHLQPQSNQAISSQSFIRHDVPLSYQYSWVHVYTTPEPEQEYKQKTYVAPPQHLVRKQYPQLQYAPILNEEQANRHSPIAINIVEENTNLEPKPSGNSPETSKTERVHHHHHHEHLSYVPGYNIEVLQTVNKYPGHNAVYRSYPNMTSSERLNKINFLNQYVRSQNKDEDVITTHKAPTQPVATHTSAHRIPTLTSFVPIGQPNGPAKEQNHNIQAVYPSNLQMVNKGPQDLPTDVPLVRAGYHPHPDNVLLIPSGQHPPKTQVDTVMQNVPIIYARSQPLINVQEYLNMPHPKAHRMLLNIARTYNIAQALVKAQHGLTLNNPSHTQAFIQIRKPSDPDKNHLLSVQNKNLYSPVHRVP